MMMTVRGEVNLSTTIFYNMMSQIDFWEMAAAFRSDRASEGKIMLRKLKLNAFRSKSLFQLFPYIDCLRRRRTNLCQSDL